ncbi:PIN domain-containing protein [Bdellovibrionota bacterium FG-2]
MIVVADTSVILDFLDGDISDPYALVRPYRLILISPVVLHEVLRTFPDDYHSQLFEELRQELLPAPRLEHWIEAAQVMRTLYSRRHEKNMARMQNNILIALAAREVGAPVWSRDADFEIICNHLGIGLLKQ